ncbi:protein croquemort-like isoform X2 [Planococcus citri]
MSGKMARIVKYLLYGFGGVFLLLGLAITGFWRPLYRHLLASNLALTNGSQAKELWTNGAVPLYFRVYMFNWTNPIQTLGHIEKPNFEENGPYTFRFQQLKSDIVWNNNHTVTYNGRRVWDFVPEKSKGSLTDIITSINVVAVSIGDQARWLNHFDKILVNQLLAYNEKQLYVTKTVEELLFQGYQDKILDLGKILKKYIKNFDYMTDKFGWYFGKNESQVDVYNIHTGTDNIDVLGNVHAWNYKTQCGVYSGRCDQVHGSLGDLWPMNITEGDIASLFISDLCGAFDMSKIGPRELYDVEGVRFAGTERTFDNGGKYPENSCYCKDNQCTMAPGVRNLSACLRAPIYVSFPHFYLADPSYTKDINGMNPSAEKHEFSFTMQKDSGVMMEIFARLQINVKVEAFQGLNFFSNLPSMLVPSLWFDQYIEMPDEFKRKLKFGFNQVPNLLAASGFVFVILGALLLVSGFVVARLSYSSVPYTVGDI